MPYTKTKLNPFPYASKLVSDKILLITSDWIRYFNGLCLDIIRTMSSYDSQSAGTATLVAGTVVIANTLVTADSKIRLSAQNLSGTPGFLYVTLSPSVGFTITSNNAADTRTILYEILEAF